jgi:Type II/IV secretion system protein
MTLNWPPAPPAPLPRDWAPESAALPASAGQPASACLPVSLGSLLPQSPASPEMASSANPVTAGPGSGLTDPLLIAGVGEITGMIAAQLHDRADAADVLPAIRSTARGWLEREVRAGLLPASAGRQLDELVSAVYDQRYGLGPITGFLRDPQVENVDINGCDQVWITYATGERVLGPPVAATDDALISMVRSWAARGGQTARDFSAAAPLVSVALTGGARMTATMSVTPRPCVSLRRHGQPDVTLARLIALGTIDPGLAAFLAAAVRSRCNVIITGGVNCGKTTIRLKQP